MGTPYSQATTSVPNSGGSKAASILGGGLAGAGIGSMLPATALGGFGLPIAVGAGLLSGFLK